MVITMLTFKPKVRGSFSDRYEKAKINTIIQKDNLDERTRNSIVNIFDIIINICNKKISLTEMYEYIFKYIFFVTEDEIPYDKYEQRKVIVNGIKKDWAYYDVFSFLESFLNWYSDKFYDYEVYNIFNNVFESECVGYRFVDKKITDIINDEEIKEIEEAINSKYSSCRKCISKALNLLYNREKPDYSNSVKESISSIESMCNIILDSKSSTLGEALNKLEKKGFKIHGAMKSAFSSLYGYTSDKSGIRHNLGIDENTTFEEAKYMLVACSAFLNYLIQIYEKDNKKE